VGDREVGVEMKHFIGSCVGNPFKTVNTLCRIVDEAKEINQSTFISECEISEEQIERFCEYPNDYGFYKNNEVMFYKWSSIEHFYK